MALYKGSIRLAGIGSFPDQIQYMSQDDYNALSEEAKMNGTTYGIVGDSDTSSSLKFEFFEKKTLNIVPTPSGNYYATVSLGTYNDDVYVIAKKVVGSNSNQIALGQKNGITFFPYGQGMSVNMTAAFLKGGIESFIFVYDNAGGGDYDIYVYSINLPE